MPRALAVLTLALAALALGAGPAQAAQCTTDGSERVCIAKLKESCSPGPPYRCRVARDECRFREGRLVRCEYTARRRVCRGFGGVKCSLAYKTACTTDRVAKRCRTDSGTSCRSGSTTTCRRTVDSCRTKVAASGFSCSFTTVVERCNDTICRTTRTTCRTSSSRGKRCFATFSSGGGRDAGSSGNSQEDAPTPDDGDFEDEPASDEESAPPPIDDGLVDDGTTGGEAGGPPPQNG